MADDANAALPREANSDLFRMFAEDIANVTNAGTEFLDVAKIAFTHKMDAGRSSVTFEVPVKAGIYGSLLVLRDVKLSKNRKMSFLIDLKITGRPKIVFTIQAYKEDVDLDKIVFSRGELVKCRQSTLGKTDLHNLVCMAEIVLGVVSALSASQQQTVDFKLRESDKTGAITYYLCNFTSEQMEAICKKTGKWLQCIQVYADASPPNLSRQIIITLKVPKVGSLKRGRAERLE